MVFQNEKDAIASLAKIESNPHSRGRYNIFRINMGGGDFFILAQGYAEASHLMLRHIGVQVVKVKTLKVKTETKMRKEG